MGLTISQTLQTAILDGQYIIVHIIYRTVPLYAMNISSLTL